MDDINQKTSKEEKQGGGVTSILMEGIKFAVLAIIIVIPIRIYIAQPYIVRGASMSPTFESGEYLIVDQLSYRFSKPEYGDVVIFKFPQEPSKFFIKRIIGTPGDTVLIENGFVSLVNKDYPEGIQIEESYVSRLSRDTQQTQLKEDEYFVMGDNRNASLDSRNWGILIEDLVVGRVLFRLSPISKISIFPGKVEIVPRSIE